MNLEDVSKKTNSYCREYCMKDHTAVEGYEFFEHGNFKHEKQRTDWVEIKEDIKNKLPFDLMFEKYPHLMIHNHKRIDEIQQRLLKEQYKNVERPKVLLAWAPHCRSLPLQGESPRQCFQRQI